MRHLCFVFAIACWASYASAEGFTGDRFWSQTQSGVWILDKERVKAAQDREVLVRCIGETSNQCQMSSPGGRTGGIAECIAVEGIAWKEIAKAEHQHLAEEFSADDDLLIALLIRAALILLVCGTPGVSTAREMTPLGMLVEDAKRCLISNRPRDQCRALSYDRFPEIFGAAQGAGRVWFKAKQREFLVHLGNVATAAHQEWLREMDADHDKH